jgi:hypothetical protein
MTTNIPGEPAPRAPQTRHALLATLMWGKDGKVRNAADARLDAPVRTRFTSQPPRTLREGLFFEGE